MRIFSIVVLVALVVGCVSKRAPARDESGAVAIARNAIAAKETWADTATFEAKRVGSGWSVHVWREPRVWGGDRMIVIDRDGKVTGYYYGK
jgi:hypothetical protein